MGKWTWLAICTCAVIAADQVFHAVVGTSVDLAEIVSVVAGMLIAVFTFPAQSKERG